MLLVLTIKIDILNVYFTVFTGYSISITQFLHESKGLKSTEIQRILEHIDNTLLISLFKVKTLLVSLILCSQLSLQSKYIAYQPLMARLGHFARVASKNENLCSEDWCLINFFMKLSFSNKLSKTHKCEIINTPPQTNWRQSI